MENKRERKKRGASLVRRPLLLPWLPPLVARWKGKGAPLPHYINPLEEESTNTISTSPSSTASPNTSKVRRPPLVCHPLPLYLSLSPAWPPEGLRRRLESPPLHAVVLRSFRIPIPKPLLPHLGWKRGSGSHRGRRTYAEVPLVRCRSRCAKFFTTLRSATTSSTAALVRERNPRVSVFEGT
jgi:hypothetical protein